MAVATQLPQQLLGSTSGTSLSGAEDAEGSGKVSSRVAGLRLGFRGLAFGV